MPALLAIWMFVATPTAGPSSRTEMAPASGASSTTRAAPTAAPSKVGATVKEDPPGAGPASERPAASIPLPEKILGKVRASYGAAGDLESAFRQVYVDSLRNRRREESGRLWAKRDGRVRWTYLKPERKDFVYDGRTAYFYEPEYAQVTQFDQFRDSPLSQALGFLAGQGDLAAVFTPRPCAKLCELAQKNEVLVELWPKQNMPTVEHVLLVVDGKTYRVRASVLFDPLGNRTEYYFEDMRVGKTLPDERFVFELPQGVSVLRPTLEPQAPGPAPTVPAKGN